VLSKCWRTAKFNRSLNFVHFQSYFMSKRRIDIVSQYRIMLLNVKCWAGFEIYLNKCWFSIRRHRKKFCTKWQYLNSNFPPTVRKKLHKQTLIQFNNSCWQQTLIVCCFETKVQRRKKNSREFSRFNFGKNKILDSKTIKMNKLI
jgi:hypothetical protein